ncbi:GNAT family N-acetyltransferase [Microbacterium sp. 1P10UB]|uniref:GNAT family N-acetyltransferase n=1 Tax=unclassified Microbacterium TaxID=2609290 RepID=UPI0039A13F1F
MTDIVIAPATADRFDDAEHALTGGGDGATCQCQWWTITNSEFNASTLEQREGMLRTELDGEVPPALIAYVDGAAAGWVRVGPRTLQRRIARTRMIVQNSTEPMDDEGVWAVSCFAVRSEHRGRRLNRRLLDDAIAFARDRGARALEAYPVDTAVGTHHANELYHGLLSVFEEAGFREVARPKPDRPIVLLDLTS